ncbi:major facilitator superfamily domain-containing protein [Coniochaeta sp. 2T2.1]|nr:major facilitator superfamily domain-containing protein [Coniochaeta sp. 2T2.1]
MKHSSVDAEKIQPSQHETAAGDMSEKGDLEQTSSGKGVVARLDKAGLPLVPQPTSHKDDPLNWSPSLKLLVTLQISWLAMLGPMGSAVVNPAFVTMGKVFHKTPVQISYELTVYIVFAGIGPLLIVPFANVYGRRPIYLLGNLIAAVTNLAAGYCNTWTGIMVTRALNGVAAGSTVAIGAATICDLYFQHERGLYMGIYTFFLTNGPHIAPLIGGFVSQYVSWQACFYIPGYIQLGTFAITLVSLPETLYSRGDNIESMPYKERSFLDLLLFRRSHATRRLQRRDFTRPFEMLRYITFVIPAIYYMTCFGYGTVLFALTGSKLFAQFYHFTNSQIGLLLSIPLTVGCLIGEFSAGWVTDWVANRYAKAHGGDRLPEARLDVIWGSLLIPIGVIIEGICLSHHETVGWIGSAFGMAIAGLGLQIATTVLYAYTTDCYKPQSAEISTMFNTFRQVFSCLISFYAIPLGDEIGYEFAWLTFALINLALLVPVVMLRFYGPRLRSLSWQAPPSFHNDL